MCAAQRVRRRERLQVQNRHRKTRRLSSAGSERRRARRANEVWSWDFVHDMTEHGGRFTSSQPPPWGQAYIESFHDKLRDECTNRERFENLREASVIMEEWRQEDNRTRPHSALGYQTSNEFEAGCNPASGRTPSSLRWGLQNTEGTLNHQPTQNFIDEVSPHRSLVRNSWRYPFTLCSGC